jgi:serine/threonine-protein kinase HipA
MPASNRLTMTSRRDSEAYVWVWLPAETDPVVAGRLKREGDELLFNYGRSYLARDDRISLYEKELPLERGRLPLPAGLTMPGCIRDGAPDAWGRRVLLNRLLGAKGKDADTAELGELTYLLESGSDRIGALDFQRSPTDYIARMPGHATLDELLNSAEKVEQGIPLTPELDAALQHGSSIGGARPKAMITADNKKYIAKFASTADFYSVVKAEFIAMHLARRCRLDAAPVKLTRALNKDVLLVERFDRAAAEDGWHRRSLLSALTLLGLDEMMARYASYEDLAEIIRREFDSAAATLRELFGRLVFNVLCGNTDDHARNHAAFWDGTTLSLTPAYDICPQTRTGNEDTQKMLISGDDRRSRLATCLAAASAFLLKEAEAIELIETQIVTIRDGWMDACERAGLTETDRRLLWGRQFLNPFAFEELEAAAAPLAILGAEAR